MSAVRFVRRDTGDGASEILTLVRIGGTDLAIEICAGLEIGDDFVGLYDLDGDQLTVGNASWEVVDRSEVSAEQIESIRLEWETGMTAVTEMQS